MKHPDTRTGGGLIEVADLGIETISRSLARARAQVLLRESAGEDERSLGFWRRREQNLETALARAQRQLRVDHRARLAVTQVVGRIARRIAPRQRGAGRPGTRRAACATASGGDPPDSEHHLAGRRP
jgi:hypothetical protein